MCLFLFWVLPASFELVFSSVLILSLFGKKVKRFLQNYLIFLYFTFYRMCKVLQIAKKSLSVFGKPNFSDISAPKSYIGGKTKFIMSIYPMKTVHHDMRIAIFGIRWDAGGGYEKVGCEFWNTCCCPVIMSLYAHNR